MGILSGLFSSRQKKIGPYIIDAFITETHKSDVTLTQFPVEFGANITDHAVLEPLKLSLEGIVSNSTPLIFGAEFRVPTGLDGSKFSRSTNAYLSLLRLQQQRELIDVQTGLVLYKNMLLQSLTIDRSRTTADSLFFSAKLEAIIIVNTSEQLRSSSQYSEGKARDQAGPNVDSGRISNSNASTAEASAALSWINNISGI